MPTLHPTPLTLALLLALSLAPTPATAARKAKAPAVTPACSDFHGMANEGWLAAHTIVAGKGMESALGELAGRARE